MRTKFFIKAGVVLVFTLVSIVSSAGLIALDRFVRSNVPGHSNIEHLDLQFTLGMSWEELNIAIGPDGSLEGWGFTDVPSYFTLFTNIVCYNPPLIPDCNQNFELRMEIATDLLVENLLETDGDQIRLALVGDGLDNFYAYTFNRTMDGWQFDPNPIIFDPSESLPDNLAWGVVDGPVPLPGAIWLFLSAAIWLFWASKFNT